MAQIKSGVKASETIKGKSERRGGETIEEGTAGWPEACFSSRMPLTDLPSIAEVKDATNWRTYVHACVKIFGACMRALGGIYATKILCMSFVYVDI